MLHTVWKLGNCCEKLYIHLFKFKFFFFNFFSFSAFEKLPEVKSVKHKNAVVDECETESGEKAKKKSWKIIIWVA